MAALNKALQDMFTANSSSGQMSSTQFSAWAESSNLTDARCTTTDMGLIFSGVKLGKKTTINYDRFMEACRKRAMKKEITFQALIQTAGGDEVRVEEVQMESEPEHEPEPAAAPAPAPAPAP